MKQLFLVVFLVAATVASYAVASQFLIPAGSEYDEATSSSQFLIPGGVFMNDGGSGGTGGACGSHFMFLFVGC